MSTTLTNQSTQSNLTPLQEVKRMSCFKNNLFEIGVLHTYVTVYSNVKQDKKEDPEFGKRMKHYGSEPRSNVAEMMEKYPYEIMYDRNLIVFGHTEEAPKVLINNEYNVKEVTPEERKAYFKKREALWEGYTIHEDKEVVQYTYNKEFYEYLANREEYCNQLLSHQVVEFYYYGFVIPTLRKTNQQEYLKEIELLDELLNLPDELKEPSARINNIFEVAKKAKYGKFRGVPPKVSSLTHFERGILSSVVAPLSYDTKGKPSIIVDDEHQLVFQSEELKQQVEQAQTLEEKLKAQFLQVIPSEKAYEQHKAIALYKSMLGTYPEDTVQVTIFGVPYLTNAVDARDDLYLEVLPHYKDIPFTLNSRDIYIERGYINNTEGKSRFSQKGSLSWYSPEDYLAYKENATRPY